ncbi:MAG: hypothetical protein M3082_11735 [Candidatus Dormibacteraeota bacterium]|nr:hypothetical protein [Candidatus Dormibacteraeota bacterium]
MNSIYARLVTTAVAALTLVMAGAPVQAAASSAQAAGLKNCNDVGVTPCFELVWANGVQVKVTFVNLNPKPSNAPTVNFYVMAPQTGTPQGWVPFLHDHVTGDRRAGNHDDDRGDTNRVRYHGFFVLCSAQGISSGGCVPAITSIPGLGTIPFAKTVHGQQLTSVGPIESPANAGLLTIFDTGGVFIATINSRREDR